MKNRLCITTVVLLALVATGALAQKQKMQKAKTVKVAAPAQNKPTEDAALNEKKVRDMVTFLGFMFNTLGSNNTSVRDKDVLITESYSKIFRDAKVQVEDDLDEERSVITNKDIVAYMKDINFFFKEVKFEFTIDKIEQAANADNQTFYKVSLQRNLSGTTADGKTVNNIVPRFIEINFDNKEQDLKIVSIYTHEFNENEALRSWWKQLSYEWQNLLKKKLSLTDSVSISDIKKIISSEELNLRNNQYIQSFEPLSQLKNLKTLDLSFTTINDLTPIRNLTDIGELNISHTQVRDLSPLKYAGNLVKLNVNHTQINDISVLQRMPKLQSLDASVTPVIDVSAIAGLGELTSLNLNNTKISDLAPLESLTSLTELDISQTLAVNLTSLKGLASLQILTSDSTRIQNISPLSGLENLKVLHVNYTLISDLQPLQRLTHLEKIYCDQSPIKKVAADAFMSANPRVLVVYDSHDLKSWWSTLSPEWQGVISKAAKITLTPTIEELAKVGNIDSVNFSGNGRITDVEPLRNLEKLRVVIAGKTSIQDLSPLHDLIQIQYLDISETRVTSFSALGRLTKLKVVKADHCKLESIDPAQKLTSLKRLYVDDTGINDINAQEFLQANPKCLLIYKTVHLSRWWRNLFENWKDVLRAQMQDTTRESFHKLVEQEKFHFKDAQVSDLSGLSEFILLNELHFSGTAIVTIAPLENLKSLKSLHATHGPLQITESLSQLTELEDLDISDTPVEDLTVIWKLQNLKNLNCSGTQVKRLDAVAKLEKLENFDCSNTNVGKLTALDYLHLKSLKCYNTRVSQRAIENFKASHPDCKVIFYK